MTRSIPEERLPSQMVAAQLEYFCDLSKALGCILIEASPPVAKIQRHNRPSLLLSFKTPPPMIQCNSPRVPLQMANYDLKTSFAFQNAEHMQVQEGSYC